MFGYHGRYLRIDVTDGSATTRPLSETVLRRMIGGVGLGAWLLHREAPPCVDPYSPAAPLIFAFSPLVGTPLTTSAKFAIVAKSPLTQRINDALSSSHFALAGKRTGFDALVIVGVCAEPKVLLIDEDTIRLEPAGAMWGQSAQEAAAGLSGRFGARFHAAVIGQAGENLVRYATISHERRHAGRGGLGAVMGSKRLKAIGVTGSQRTDVGDPAGVVAMARDLSRRSFGPATAKYRELGTVSNLLTFNRLNALPTRNFQSGQFEDAIDLSGESLNETRRLARESCASCTIGCEHIYAAPGGPVRLEYESLFALGPLCGISDRDGVLEAARRCDEFGLDTISTGATIAFAMECAERGWINAPGLRFGNTAAMLDLIADIAHRRGIGNLLAEGTRRAAEAIGKGAPAIAPHVKGLELPGYEPRSLQTMALGFAVGARGADHNRSGAYEADFSTAVDRRHGTTESATFAVDTEDRAALIDSLILCKFLRGVFTDLFAESAELLAMVTGWNMTRHEMRKTARRIVAMKKLFNVREGWNPAEDTLPDRFLTEALPVGSAPGASLSRDRLQEMIRAYYVQRGWNADGTLPGDMVRELETLIAE